MKLPRILPFFLLGMVCAAAADPVATPLPISPGFHDLFCSASIAGKPRRMAYDIWLPRGYSSNRRWPMVVYLVGQGDRGEDASGLFHNGPPLNLKTSKSLADWAPFIVLTPRCPQDLEWDSPGVNDWVVQLIGDVKSAWAVDADRVYLTGLSMGGRATWRVALAASDTFAAIAPVSSLAVESAQFPQALKNTTVCIICGGKDGPHTEGSRKMFAALQHAGADALYVEIPGAGHIAWPPFYASQKFYEYLLMHRRGQPPPINRPSAKDLLAIACTPLATADAELKQPLQSFLPWWFLSNCGRANAPGLKEQALGHKNVFVTTPLDRDVPCSLMYTTTISKQTRTLLKLTVAAPPGDRWELAVLAENKELLKQVIGSSSNGPWVEVEVDLSAFSGQQVHLELQDRTVSSGNSQAYWGSVQIAEEAK